MSPKRATPIYFGGERAGKHVIIIGIAGNGLDLGWLDKLSDLEVIG